MFDFNTNTVLVTVPIMHSSQPIYLILGNSCNYPFANLLSKHLHPD